MKRDIVHLSEKIGILSEAVSAGVVPESQAVRIVEEMERIIASGEIRKVGGDDLFTYLRVTGKSGFLSGLPGP